MINWKPIQAIENTFNLNILSRRAGRFLQPECKCKNANATTAERRRNALLLIFIIYVSELNIINKMELKKNYGKLEQRINPKISEV